MFIVSQAIEQIEPFYIVFGYRYIYKLLNHFLYFY